jgi:glucosylceramidase
MKKIFFPATAFLLFACTNLNQQRASPASANHFSLEGKKAIVYTTADSTDYRLTVTDTLAFADSDEPAEAQPCVFVDPSHSFQNFLGIGGALTDAAAETFSKLPAEKQKELLQAYYDTTNGIGYTIGRTNMNSCDFSGDMYTYVKEGDKELTSFSIAHDERFRIPLIKKAMEATGGKLNLFISPWSPPSWMKDNNDMLHGGKLKPEFYGSWANYYIKFIQALEKDSVPVWGLTVQNEPMATQRWESCVYTAAEERDFIKNYLGPALQKNDLGNKKLIAWDHNRNWLYQRASTLLNDADAAKYIWGIGFHWYSESQFDNVKRVSEAFPEKALMLTEGANGDFDPQHLNDWSLGENYGLNMINDFNNGAVAWTDWNILLDENGGPNHVGNFSFAPVHANVKDGTLRYLNSYYYIGHFSKFIRPGARRIISSSNTAQLLTTAFMNKDGRLVIIVMNPTNEKCTYRMNIGKKVAETSSYPHSIATVIL